MKIKLINKKTIYFNNNKILDRYTKNLNHVFSWMKKLDLKKPVILDIGANIGMYSICYSKIFSDSVIYAFEPVKKNYKTLISNIKKNKIQKINTNNFGLLDKKKRLKIGIPDSRIHERYQNDINDGLFSIFAKKKKNWIKVITLDNFIKIRKINKIDFIKIDVEGAEALVLNGSKNTIRKFKPVIQLEFNKLTEILGNKKISYFQKFAKKFDYKIFYLVKNYKLREKINLKKDFFSDLILISRKNK